MLTPIDIHYLVGLLTAVSHPDDVEIELGNMVFDTKAHENRDVDVTVTWKDSSGNITAFKGIEVNGRKRRLDITRVEQLCQKCNDMPSITQRAIVSELSKNLFAKALNTILMHEYESIKSLGEGQAQDVVISMQLRYNPHNLECAIAE